MGDEQYWNSLAALNDELYSSEWCRFEDDTLREDLSKLLRQVAGKRVLDLGCGTGLGYELLEVNESDIHYMGVDISKEMLSVFKSKHPEANLIEASAGTVMEDLGGHEFDLIISTNVAASFFPDIEGVVRNTHKILAPGGIVSLSFLNRFSLRRLLRLKLSSIESNYRSRGDKSNQPPISASTYRRSDMETIFVKAGFNDVGCQYRSILGGVLEHANLLGLEKTLAKFLPNLGHALIVSGRKV